MESQPNASGRRENLTAFGSLALAGLFAGILMVAFESVLPGPAEDLYAAFFGLFVVGYFVGFRGLRSPWKAMGFVATSVLAYIVAFWACLTVPVNVKFLSFMSSGSVFVSTAGLFVGGFVGAAILLAGFFFFLSDRKEWRLFVAKALPFSLIAGLVAVFAWKAGSFLGAHFGRTPASSDWDFDLLHILWQAAVAASFGFFLPRAYTPSRRVE